MRHLSTEETGWNSGTNDRVSRVEREARTVDRTPGTSGSDQLGENYLRSVDLELDRTGRKNTEKKKTDVVGRGAER